MDWEISSVYDDEEMEAIIDAYILEYDSYKPGPTKSIGSIEEQEEELLANGPKDAWFCLLTKECVENYRKNHNPWWKDMPYEEMLKYYGVDF